MEELFVKTATTQYPIYIKDSFDDLIQAFKTAGLTGRKVCVIADTNTDRLYLNDIKKKFEGNFKTICSYTFEAGENSKNLDIISEFYKCFVNNGLDRKSVIVALGGGVVGDMAGFAASSYMRGITFVQMPTTLLSQVDSSVGGKVGVDFMGHKNMVGAFYQPAFVYINIKTLNTLPQNQFSAGMAETIKYGYIIDKSYLEMIEQNKELIKSLDLELLKKVIYGACNAKAFVVSKDEKESGLRELLNFGHTFGHSIESLSDFKFLHGECVAIGMVAALYLSVKKGNINISEVKRLTSLLEYFNLPISVNGFDRDKVYSQMILDKKTTNNAITLVLLKEIGKAYSQKNTSIDEIYSAIDKIIL